MNMKRFLALLLAAATALLFLTGCKNTGTPVMTLGKYKLTENMYSYWLSCYKTNFLYSFNNAVDNPKVWSTVLNSETGETYADYVTKQINQTISFYLVAMKLFSDYGLKISSETSKQINQDIQEKIDYYGSRAEVNTALSAYGVNLDILKDIYIIQEKFFAVYDYLYGDNGIEALTEEEIDAYYRSHYSRVRMIVVYTKEKALTDSEGNYTYDGNGNVKTVELTEEEKQEKEIKIQEVLSKLDQGEDFESLMKQYSEVNSSYYENGLYVSSGSYENFGYKLVEEAIAMNPGEISRVDDEEVTYIVRKEDVLNRGLFKECDKEQLQDLTKLAIADAYTKKFSELAKDIVFDLDLMAQYSVVTAPMNTTF